MRKLRYLIEFAIIWLPYRIIRISPRVTLAPFSRLIARIMIIIPGIHRLTIANIRVAFPKLSDAEVRHIGRESLFHLLLNLLEFVWMSDNPGRIEQCTCLPSPIVERLRAHVAAGERIIFVNPHLGSWEASGLMAPYYADVKMVAIAKPIRNPYLNRLFNRGHREKADGLKIIFSKGAVKASIKALREGYGVGTLIDQNTRVRNGGIFVDFFGLPVPSSKAPATLMHYCRANNIPAVIIFGTSIRINGIVTAHAEWLSKPFEKYADEQEIIQELMNFSESYIRRFPEQYLWFYKRFQYIPRDIDEALKRRYPSYAKVAGDRFY